MTPLPMAERLRRQMDDLAPPITLTELGSRPLPRVGGATRPVLRAASVVIVLMAVGVGVAAAMSISTDDNAGEVRASDAQGEQHDGAPTSTGSVGPPGGAGGWPDIVSSTGQAPELVLSSLETGEITGGFAPAFLAVGGLTGAVGSADGRLAAWSGGRVVVQDDGTSYDLDLGAVPPGGTVVAGAVRILFLPSTPAVWVVASSGGRTQVLRWDYTSSDLPAPLAEIATGAVPAGVAADGTLVLNSEDPSVGAPEAVVTVVEAGLVGEPSAFDGAALSVGRDAALIRRCEADGTCRLHALGLEAGDVEAIATGDIDPAAVRSLIGPTVPSESAPLPTGDPGSDRVLVNVEIGPERPQDQPTTLAIVDLDALRLDRPDGGLEDIVAAAWSCDGSDVAGLRSDGSWASLSGADVHGSLPDATFLYALGRC
jgi:hypothetical protein